MENIFVGHYHDDFTPYRRPGALDSNKKGSHKKDRYVWRPSNLLFDTRLQYINSLLSEKRGCQSLSLSLSLLLLYIDMLYPLNLG